MQTKHHTPADYAAGGFNVTEEGITTGIPVGTRCLFWDGQEHCEHRPGTVIGGDPCLAVVRDDEGGIHLSEWSAVTPPDHPPLEAIRRREVLKLENSIVPVIHALEWVTILSERELASRDHVIMMLCLRLQQVCEHQAEALRGGAA